MTIPLSLVGWVNGISITCFFIINVILGLFFFYKSIKLYIRILSYAGLMIIFTGLFYLIRVIDFIVILSTNNNIDNTYGIFGIFSYIFVPISVSIGIILGAELIIPKKKWIIISIYIVLTIIFEIVLFLDTMNSIEFIYPSNAGEDLLDAFLIRNSPLYIIIIIYLISIIAFDCVGFLYKGIKSTGSRRKRFFMLSVAFTLFITCSTLETSISGVVLVFVRITMLVPVLLTYFALKIREPNT